MAARGYWRVQIGFLVLGLCAGRDRHERRLVAIADLHGDLDAGLRALRLAELIDEAGSWAGGDAVLVQTGDLVDRGGEAKQLYELFQRLGTEAAGVGGEVHCLLGNHEVMNMQNDVRYVNQTDYMHFGGAKARAKAFSPAGELGAWLRSLPVTVVLGDTLFVHAGITKTWASMGIAKINAMMRAALSSSEGTAFRPSILSAHGPIWYRGYHELDEKRACFNVRQALELLGASRMVIGHNIQDERVRVRCDGAIHLIDIAMSSAIYGKHIVVWECVGCLGGADVFHASRASIRAVYDDMTVQLAAGGRIAPFRDDLLRR